MRRLGRARQRSGSALAQDRQANHPHRARLSRDARRAARDARSRQHAQACAVGSARRRRVHQSRHVRHARSVRRLQRLQARLSDRRRHGEDEDRGDGGACSSARDRLARTDHCRTAALRAAGRNLCRIESQRAPWDHSGKCGHPKGGCRSNKEVAAILEGPGLGEGSNHEPGDYVLERAFVG